ncbi:MAG: class I SAM-dependent methyltransferase [Nitrospirae bacterium]|nr:class I SAM-dependent methyltransferase [Nitrospirota bacterium]
MVNYFECKNCGSPHVKVKYAFHSVDKRILQCTKCELMVIHPMPTQENLLSVYNENYYNNEKLTSSDITAIYGYSDYMAERINKQQGYQKICQTINRYNPVAHNQRLLDFGCGLGHFMDSAYDTGYSVSGVEFNAYAIEYIRKRYTYKVISFDEFNKTNEKVNIITMFDVIEHMPNPFETLDRIGMLLEKDGLLVISTMDSRSWLSKLMGKRLEDFRRITEHIYFFSRKNLSEILIKKGFDILEVKSIGHSFELKYLNSRIMHTIPLIGVMMRIFLKVFPFLGDLNIYINPFTKMIIYARNRNKI